MTVIGITGPSGAGKGEVSRILNEKYLFPILNADEIYHSQVSSPSPCTEEIKAEFGEKVITQSGSLDRRALADIVFGDNNKEKLAILNKITHKHVVAEIEASLRTLSKTAKTCVIDAPLLIEAGLTQKCDITFCVLAPKDVRAARISKRDNISTEAALKRINSQKEDNFYIENTDLVIINDGDISLLSTQIESIMQDRGIIT